jgi:hypothetical protein
MRFNFVIPIKLIVFGLCLSTLCCSSQPRDRLTASQNQPPVIQTESSKISKVTFFIENSESMFGYVSSISEYVEAVAELSDKSEFVKDYTNRDFYFINGDSLVLNHIGSNPAVLRSKLNATGFNCGNIKMSNLNAMFQVALEKANNNNISILISDGIYDIGGSGLNALPILGKGTRSKFIKRLQQGDLQTIMIKLNSKFFGKYFYVSQPGSTVINSLRPFYIWIFGDSKLLNKYFTNEYISTKLKGYENMARFMKPGSIPVQYQATADNSIGTFKFDHKTNNFLTNAKPDSHGLGFQFSIAVDYSLLPFPESYLINPAQLYC